MLQATAAMALVPIGVPISSPRSVSVTDVKGWQRANCCSPSGIVVVGTNPLPKKTNWALVSATTPSGSSIGSTG